MCEEMEMPTPCQKCGEIFDLLDGMGSLKWFPNTTICESCGDEESKEIERDEEITEHKERIESAVWDINDAIKQLAALDYHEIENPLK